MVVFCFVSFVIFSVLFVENLLEELDEDHGRVEVEEDRQRKSHALNDDPRHEAEKFGLEKISFNLQKIL